LHHLTALNLVAIETTFEEFRVLQQIFFFKKILTKNSIAKENVNVGANKRINVSE
jgi:hypothetical protein